MIMQKSDAEQKHEEWAYYPSDEHGGAEQFHVFKQCGYFAVIHFSQRRIHHQYQAQSQRNIGGATAHHFYSFGNGRYKISDGYTQNHG
jgi:hypothetical protein